MLQNRFLKVFLLVLAVLLLATASGENAMATGRDVTVRIDGRPVVFDVAPQIVRERVMVPLKAIAGISGAAVDWDAARRTVTVEKGGNRIVLTVGSDKATHNGRQVALDSPVVIAGGRTLVPLRFISETLGYGVTWDGKARRVSLTSRLDRLNLLGPIAPLTFPFLRLMDTDALSSITSQTQVHIARTVDMLRAQALTGEMHFAAMPTYVAANLYNRGIKLKLVNVSVWGNLYIVGEGGAPVKSLADLKGQRLIIPSRGDTPDLVFRFLAAGKGLDIARDLQIEYVPSPMEAAGLLATGRARFAVLSEPAATSALQRARQEGRTLERLIPLRKVWGEVTRTADRMPQAGIVALPAITGRDDLIKAFNEAYSQAATWALSNPDGMGALAEKGIEGLRAPAAASALQFSELRAIPAIEVRPELEFYFSRLQELAPDIIGGKLPDAGFYWQPK
ncbi:MAG: PhnD/SsuA/transferrin family substrate-binding protein [Syntrophomonadaceae bacterium]|nr:PhnD/SsuA/transferrin family substrate-binding protein [Syntrophomonadaceae bacterium]